MELEAKLDITFLIPFEKITQMLFKSNLKEPNDCLKKLNALEKMAK